MDILEARIKSAEIGIVILKQVKEEECSKEAWDLVSNALEHLNDMMGKPGEP